MIDVKVASSKSRLESYKSQFMALWTASESSVYKGRPQTFDFTFLWHRSWKMLGCNMR